MEPRRLMEPFPRVSLPLCIVRTRGSSLTPAVARRWLGAGLGGEPEVRQDWFQRFNAAPKGMEKTSEKLVYTLPKEIIIQL